MEVGDERKRISNVSLLKGTYGKIIANLVLENCRTKIGFEKMHYFAFGLLLALSPLHIRNGPIASW